MSPWQTLLHVVEGIVLTYTVLYLVTNSVILLLAFRPTLDQVRGRGFEDLDLLDGGSYTVPTVAIIVPAYDEETTIVETIRSLMAVDYPSLELVVVNDGSQDRTRGATCEAFGLLRRDVPVRDDLPTAPLRAVYEATRDLPTHVERLVLVDKSNGGRADALNAGLNACTSPFFLTIDADCILDPDALKQLVRQLLDDPSIVATGGQVGVVNDCDVEDGRVVRARVARSYVGLCQTVEYLRAFSLLRTGLSRLDALPILSGAFMVLRREVAVEAGGFLTGRSRSRLLEEYVGPGGATICEDMEMVVRIHRLMREQGRPARVAHAPLPLVWTEVPPTLSSLSKQRRRWHRGLLEIMGHHRRMLLDPGYGRLGLFSLPYFFWFELMGPYVEAAGLFLLPVLALLGWIEPWPVILITGLALGAGMLQSLLSMLVATWMEPTSLGGRRMRSLLGADRWADRLRLLSGCVLAELGYRQLTVFWRLHGTIDHLRGHAGWDKFERRGFRSSAARAAGVLALVALGVGFLAGPAHGEGAEPSPWKAEAVALVGTERRDDQRVSWWTEAIATWRRPSQRAHWVGLYQIERESRVDRGLVLGGAPPAGDWGGIWGELRVSPDAEFSSRWRLSLQSEFGLIEPWTGSLVVRVSDYSGLTATVVQAGAVWYLLGDWWWSNHVQFVNSRFDEGVDDEIVGFASRLSARWEDWELRLSAQRGGESYFVSSRREAREIRADVLGAQLWIPVRDTWTWIVGLDQRRPDRGAGNLYLHTGFRREF